MNGKRRFTLDRGLHMNDKQDPNLENKFTPSERIGGRLLSLFAGEIATYLHLKNSWLDENLDEDFSEEQLEEALQKLADLMEISEASLVDYLSEYTTLFEELENAEKGI